MIETIPVGLPGSRLFARSLPLVLLACFVLPSPLRAAVVNHSGTISAHTTWSRNDIHRVTGTVTVSPGIILTVESGAIVKFNAGVGLTVNGALSAVGNASEKITFTSYRDDAAGGDTNGGGPSAGQAGDWDRISFGDSVTDSLTRLEQVEVRFGGAGLIGSVYMFRANVAVVDSEVSRSSTYGIYIDQSSPQVTRTAVWGNAIHGIFTTTGSPVVEGCTLRDNGQFGLHYQGSGLATIRNSTVSGNAHGIRVQSGTASITGNTITGNESWGVLFDTSEVSPVLSGNTITGNLRAIQVPASAMPNSTDGNVLGPNGLPGIWILGNARNADLRLEVLYRGEAHEINTYQLAGNLAVGVGRKLTVDPGVVVKFVPGGELTVDGALEAVGTAEERVVFTSMRDDALGGDFNLDGAGTAPANGDWQGITFGEQSVDAQCRIEHAVVRYGGSNGSGNVFSFRTNLAIRDSEISNSSTNGVRAFQASPVLERNEVYGNTADGLRFESTGTGSVSGGRVFANFGDGIEVAANAGLTLAGSEVFANVGQGLRNGSSVAVTARGNWWGSPSGPGGSGPGTGDQVSGNVDSSGFLLDGTEYAYFDAGGTDHHGYGISLPNVTGVPSTEWGSGGAHSFLYDIESKLIRAEYAGLSPASSYRLLITYLDRDPGGAVQDLTDLNGETIHPPFRLPAVEPVTREFSVPAESILDGSLTLNFRSLSGLRAVVGAVFLHKESAADTLGPAVHLDRPLDGAVLAGGTQTVSGSVSDGASGVEGVELGIGRAAEPLVWFSATSLTSNGRWTYLWVSPSSGQYSLQARARDRLGNRALSPEAPVVTIDSSGPAAATFVLAQSLSGFQGAIRITWSLSPDDGAVPGDVDRYEIHRAEGRFLPFVRIGEVIAGVSRFDDVTAVPGREYFYLVRAVDRAGNGSDSVVYGPVTATGAIDAAPPEDVAGLTANPSQAGGGSVSIFLSWTGSVDSQGDLVDQRLYVSRDGVAYGSNPPAYDDGRFRSLGRSARSHHEGGLTAGQAYNFRLTVVDEVPNESPGARVASTPTGSPGQVVTLQGTLASSASLGAGVYHLPAGLTVPAGVALDLGPGAIVKLGPNQVLTVRGTLRATGAAGSPVVFTALSDDSWGGDSNGNGPSAGSPGAWGRVYLENSPASRLERVLVRYGGAGGSGSLHLFRSDAAVVSSEVSDGSSHGIQNQESSSVIEGSTIRGNAGIGIYHLSGDRTPLTRNNTITGNSVGIQATNNRPTITGNTITGNAGYGVNFTDASAAPRLSGNTIAGNAVALRVPASALPDSTNVLTPNARKHLEVFGNVIPSDRSLSVWARGTTDEVHTYLITGSQITVPTFTFLTIERGVVAKFGSGSGVTVNGALVAEGTAEEEIVLTATRDDFHGGDSNGDGSATVPGGGQWDGLTYNDSFFESSSRLDHVLLLYAGAGGSGALNLSEANVTVENCEVASSSTHGIFIFRASPSLVGNRIWGNGLDGILVSQSSSPTISFNEISTNLAHGIEVATSSNAAATNNQIFMNRSHGLLNSTANQVNATQNWWGDSDASGPFHPTLNPSGKGNRVSDNVRFDAFQTAVATRISYRDFSAAAGSTAGSLAPPVLTRGTLSDEWDPAARRPDRTMAWDPSVVILDYAGLDPAGRLKARVSYFNGDPSGSIQSLTDELGNPLHGSLTMPTSGPVQYEFPVPSAYYADGSLTLRFVHDNPQTSIRAAVTEVWLMDDVRELTPPRFQTVRYNDRDGSRSLTVGDEYHFRFSEEMDTSLLVDGTTDANLRLALSGGLIYGQTNQIRWTADGKTAIVTLTDGFAVTGAQLVTPTGLRDRFGNPAVGSQLLTTVDTVAPAFAGVDWADADSSGAVSLGDQFVFHFNERMKTEAIRTGTADANSHLRPSGGRRYGSSNTLSWSADGRDLTVAVTSGFSVLGDELVTPSSFVADVAGNAAQGTQRLQGRDTVPPELTAIRFDDRDGSGGPNLGDRYLFRFSEAMRSSALSDLSTEANLNLSPQGAKYGSLNRIAWSADLAEVEVLVSEGFTLHGSEMVDPSDLITDAAGNPVSNARALTSVDTVAPVAVQARGNHVPARAAANFRLTVRFSSAMDPAVEPLVVLRSSGTRSPTVPAGGHWETFAYPGDSFVTGDIVLEAGMDGTVQVDVTGARDRAANVMEPALGLHTFSLDATAPPNPAPALALVGCNAARLDWPGYAASPDLAGFQAYLREGATFGDVSALTPLAWIDKGQRSFRFEPLELERSYWLAVTAVDASGNTSAAVVPLEARIPRTVPPPVTVRVDHGPEPGSALVSWNGYSTAGLCGFAGFRLYYLVIDFDSVSGLIPRATLSPAERQVLLEGLDRTRTYHFAVVGFNAEDEFRAEVVTAPWRDPYRGEISSNLRIGGGATREVVIHEGMTVRQNATLTVEEGMSLLFTPGTGIVVESGAMVVEGTALDPVVMTSANDRQGSTPAAGDWNGITLRAGSSGSVLRHLVLRYGKGLTVEGSSPTIDALTSSRNAGAGLLVKGTGSLTTSQALLAFNQVGLRTEGAGQLVIAGSVIKQNDAAAQSAGTQTLTAAGNWWGTAVEASIRAELTGSVDIAGFLDSEPLLTPAIGAADGRTEVGTRSVELKLACRTAEEVRLSEDSTFPGIFFEAFSPARSFELSPGGGEKTIFAQYRSVTGALSPAVSVTVDYITEGPVIHQFNLAEGQLIHRPLLVAAQASAVLGMDSLEFLVDGAPVSSAAGGSLTRLWDVRDFPNGIRRVKVVARDRAGNIALSEKNVVLEVTPPPAPAITQPTTGLVVSSGPLRVRGAAEPAALVQVTRNGFVAAILTALPDGSFEAAQVPLVEGQNEVLATAQDRIGVSPVSNRVLVVLDSGPPAGVTLLPPEVRRGVGIGLLWQFAEEGERPVKFRVYRSPGPFTAPQGALLIKDGLTALDYLDRGVSDGTYYYAVLGLDSAGNAGPLSNVVSVTQDSTGPSFIVAYEPAPPFGVGAVALTLTSSEVLLATPSLTLTPAASQTPQSVLLTRLSDLQFSGDISLSASTPSGTARVLVSGQDVAGNSFSGAPAGPAFLVDTRGPSGSITPALPEPVQVAQDLSLDLVLALSEAARPGTIPALRFQPPQGESVAVALAGSGASWRGVLELRPAMGSGSGAFSLSAEDSLQNVGTSITAGGTLEIYNTALPSPPGSPGAPAVTALAEGKVQLAWAAVDRAESYQVYRSSGGCQGAPTALVAGPMGTSAHLDLPPADGRYCYAVTALRRGAESAPSPAVEGVSDRTPPGAPRNVAVALGAAGLVVAWEAPAGEAPARYRVYRNGVQVTSVTDRLTANDHPPLGGVYSYVVSALDAVGNEARSDPVPFNLTVGAVTDLVVRVGHEVAPHLTWQAGDPNAVGFNVYRGGRKLNAALLATRSYLDTFYAGASRVEYAVRAVDRDGVESPPRAVEVFPLLLEAQAGPTPAGLPGALVAGYLNAIQVSVTNRDASQAFFLEKLEAALKLEGQSLFSVEKAVNSSLLPSATRQVGLVIPMGSAQEDHALDLTVRQSASGGGVVVYQRTQSFAVSQPGMMVEVGIDEPPLAGGFATIRLCVRNQGSVDLEFVASRQNGDQPGDVHVAVLNQEGLEISRGQFRGFPAGSRLLPDGRAIISLAPGRTGCLDVQVLVPEALERNALLTFEGVVGKTYHRLGTAEQVEGGPLRGSMRSGIVLSEYFGTASADREAYSNEDTVVITGQALDRETGEPRPNVDLKIGFVVRGIHWFRPITTDAGGNYRYEYNPVVGLSGHFTIWAAHPDVFDIIRQDQFDLHRIYASPPRGDVRMSKADTIAFRIELFNPGDAVLGGFTGAFRAYTRDLQGNEVDEPRLAGRVLFPDGFSLDPGARMKVDLELQAAIDAPDSAGVEYAFTSALGGEARFTGAVSLLPAVPVLTVDEPASGFVDLSVDRGGLRSTRVRVVNKGLDALRGVELISPAQETWMTTSLPRDAAGKVLLGDLLVGDSRAFDVVFTPPADASFGYHQDKILLRGTNSPRDFEIPLFAKVTSSLTGSVQFKVVNILGQELEGATVRLRNTVIREDAAPVKTDAAGEALVTGLQEGDWSWQVVAPGHATTAGVVTVIPDQVVPVEAFPTRNLVTISFRVEPVPFTDRYEIKIEQTFETHVPVPVLVVDPPFLEFKNVQRGFDTTFVATARNAGLVKIEDLTISTADPGWGRLEPLIGFVPELGAQKTIEIPFRATYLGGAPNEPAAGGGDGLSDFADCATGGFAGLGDALAGLHSAFAGRSSCFFTPAEAQGLLNVASGILVAYSFYQAISMFVSPISFIGNALSCIAQQLGLFGSSNSGPGGGTGPASPTTGSTQAFAGNVACFAAGTPIAMADGSLKAIEELRVGDRVRDFSDRPDRVVRVYSRDVERIREVWYRDPLEGSPRRLQTTDDHAFWVEDRGWVAARKLVAGDVLLERGETPAVVVRSEVFIRKERVYNFDVERGYSYFAGGVLVHQRCGEVREDPAQERPPPDGTPAHSRRRG